MNEPDLILFTETFDLLSARPFKNLVREGVMGFTLSLKNGNGWQMVGRWFWVHKIVFTGGLQSPCSSWGASAPRTPWRGACSPPCPLHTERLRLSGSP